MCFRIAISLQSATSRPTMWHPPPPSTTRHTHKSSDFWSICNPQPRRLFQPQTPTMWKIFHLHPHSSTTLIILLIIYLKVPKKMHFQDSSSLIICPLFSPYLKNKIFPPQSFSQNYQEHLDEFGLRYTHQKPRF